jgi:hypothetical protein
VRHPSAHEVAAHDDRRNHAQIRARFYVHRRGRSESCALESIQRLERQGELESIKFEGAGVGDKIWSPVFESANSAVFCAAYGATRRVESLDSADHDLRRRGSFVRAQRVQSIFQESFVLNPLANWLPRLKSARFEEVSELLKQIVGPGHFAFTGAIEDGEFSFQRSGTSVPFPALSDGYRGFIGWVGDLLYHLCFASSLVGGKLVDVTGIVMVDEIDLFLHPKWQMRVIKTVAKALPRMQFIFTSHSPLVAGSLEWMNISLLKVNPKTNHTVVKRLKQSIHGLDADQVLLSDFFGLKTTRAATRMRQLTRLRHDATLGDDEAKRAYVRALASGMESTDNGQHDELEEDAV